MAFRELHATARQRRERLEAIEKDIAAINTKISKQERAIRDVEKRLSFFASAPAENVDPGGVAADLTGAAEEIEACERALDQVEEIGRRPAFLPGLSNGARSVIAGLAFAPIPLLVPLFIEFSSVWSIVAATIALFILSTLTCTALSSAYRVLCRPRLKEWRTNTQGRRILQPIEYLIEFSGFVACCLPAALLYLYKLVT